MALGLAAGAAVATLLPSTTVEERTLTPARDAIAEAASDAGQRLTQGIAERASEGVKELVRDVGDTVIDKISGKPQNPGALPSNVSTLPNRGS